MRKLILGIMMASSALVGCNKQTYSLPETTEEFSQNVTYNNKVDVVMMVDNSSSMSTYQDRLAAQAGGMITALNSYGMDYRIVVVTSDMRGGGNGGIFVGSPKILTPTTANLSSVLTARIKQGNGGSDLERGLQSLETALTAETNFLRSDALLAVLVLSNEDDYSDFDVNHYAQFFDTLKPKFKGVTQAWLMNFIGVPSLSSNCTTALDSIYKEPGLRWIELANISGGLNQPICDTTLGLAVNNIRQRIVEVLTEFALGRKPVLESIVVKINGKVIAQSTTDGWEYIADGNRLRLHGSAVPGSASDKISIDFKPAEAM
ncbi:MAG: vWA domain-containing protein [Pseudobdellovibrionaceae bacterium]